jgi:hypothetical protein
MTERTGVGNWLFNNLSLLEQIQEDITKIEEEAEKEKEQEVELEEPGKPMDKEWRRNYAKALILPSSGLPRNLITGHIRMVDGKQYHWDQYLQKAFQGLCVTGRIGTGRAVRNRENQLDETRL